LILVVFFFPLGLYLLVLGFIQRRSCPLVVSGAWEAIGLLAATSGFLLGGGPSILSSLHERWRMFWLLAEPGGLVTSLATGGSLWLGLSLAYYVAVVGLAVWLFLAHRALTGVYNARERQVVLALVRVCAELNLQPIRSGNYFVFGVPAAAPPPSVVEPSSSASVPPALGPAPPGGTAPPTMLQIESFRLLHHVTLRWSPAGSWVRPLVEARLARELARDATPEHDGGYWLLLLGMFLILASGLGSLLLVLRAVFHL
jgi:hypothetical protein